MTMWVVYDHPSDFPDEFVARVWKVSAAGPRADVIRAKDLEFIRRVLRDSGLVVMDRFVEDDPNILEVWM